LRALIKAEELADKINLTELTYRELIVDVGPTPAVRLCWRPEEEVPMASPMAAVSQPAPAAPPVMGSFGQGSFFERPAVVKPAVLDSAALAGAIAAPTEASRPPASPAAPARVSDWGREALDRFKKMPDLSRHRR